MAGKLTGKVTIVTGASRGIGKGIALGLGEAGATVYITGRTMHASEHPLPGTIGETAEMVTRLGGTGIAVRCDHADDTQVEALFQRVVEEQGRLDLLVNNAFSLPATDEPFSGVPFWELPIAIWDQMHGIGLRSHYVASRFAAPLMIAQGKGLIVEISSMGSVTYSFNVAYGTGKAAQDRLAVDMAQELRPHGVASLSLWPPLIKTEWVLAQPEQYPPQMLEQAVTPQFVGRVVAALAADPAIMEKSGKVLSIFAVAKEYGLTDIDGASRPVSPMHRAYVP